MRGSRRLLGHLDGWLWIPQARPRAQLRLYCFGHAGAGASAFASWGAVAPDSVEIAAIQLPGRETRISEPPLRSFAPAAEAIEHAIAHAQTPFALFGHSAGAHLAIRVACRAFERHLPLLHVFVSGSSYHRT